MSVGVITHLRNATVAETVELAVAAEAAGADWLGIPDAFWWRDTWVLIAEAARATSRIALGPLVTNPYTRHPFQTLAAIATVQEIAGPRILVGIGAGGSEVSGVARIPRTDAGERIEALVDLIRGVAAGAPLDPEAGRRLEVPLASPSVLVAGRASRVLEAAGRVADRALLWAVPTSDLERSAAIVRAGAVSGRRAPGAAPIVTWAPLVAHDAAELDHVRRIAAYAVLNSGPSLRRSWGVTSELAGEIRGRLVGGGASTAAHLIPEAALRDLVFADGDVEAIGARAAAVGATEIALPAFDLASLPARVAWARAVVARATSDTRPRHATRRSGPAASGADAGARQRRTA